MGIIDRDFLRTEGNITHSGDEIVINCRVINDTPDVEEYQLIIRSQGGFRRSEVPGVGFPRENIEPGGSQILCRSSFCFGPCSTLNGCNGWDINTLGYVFSIDLMEDEIVDELQDTVYINTARPTLVFDTEEEALASVTDVDRNFVDTSAGTCDTVCWIQRVAIGAAIIIGAGLIGYAIIKAKK